MITKRQQQLLEWAAGCASPNYQVYVKIAPYRYSRELGTGFPIHVVVVSNDGEDRMVREIGLCHQQWTAKDRCMTFQAELSRLLEVQKGRPS